MNPNPRYLQVIYSKSSSVNSQNVPIVWGPLRLGEAPPGCAGHVGAASSAGGRPVFGPVLGPTSVLDKLTDEKHEFMGFMGFKWDLKCDLMVISWGLKVI